MSLGPTVLQPAFDRAAQDPAFPPPDRRPPVLNDVPPTIEQAGRLDAAWRDPPGFIGWISAINHKTIGRRFVISAFGFFAAGGLLAAVMRLQLSRPDNTLVGPDFYNQLFTMHGTTMMFLFAVPVM